MVLVRTGNIQWFTRNTFPKRTFFYLNGTRKNLFCANCHPDTGDNGNRANEVHKEGHHEDQPEGRCVNCHIRVPHGGVVSRLINANYDDTDGTLPARYYPDGNGGGMLYLNKFIRASSPDTACRASTL